MDQTFQSGSSNGDARCLNITIHDNVQEGNQDFDVVLTTNYSNIVINEALTAITVIDDES